ncbi:hypothetical protein D6C84_01888 [Aureobasidium pullulans]|uniref:Uncharacterized protein n=1 Tax=Aureobasidium pullulans TaxID=5580 RepID=A0A4V4L1V5_AURPU|nr:hypothetical protein D6C84_01888 [Aureobasidium pullulans]
MNSTSYTPTPHALGALMKALDDDAVPIKKEPESDPIYRERSFTLAQSISSLVHAPTIEPEPIDGVKSASKQEPASLHFIEDAIMIDSNAHDHAHSDVTTDDGLKDDHRSRVSSISGIDSGSEMSPKVQLKHEIYLPNDPKSDYNTIIRGLDPKTEPKLPVSNNLDLPTRCSDKELLRRAQSSFKSYTGNLYSGNASRSYWRQTFCAEDLEIYHRTLGHLKGLEGFNWIRYTEINLSTLAASASSRSEEQERQLLEALHFYRSPTDVQSYLEMIAPEGEMADRARRLSARFERSEEDIKRSKGKSAKKAKNKETKKMEAEKKAVELIEQKAEESRLREQQIAEHKAEELRLKDKQIAEQKAEFEQAIQRLKSKKVEEEEEERRLKRVKDGIDTRHRLAPRRQVTESESFLIGRLVVEVRTAEAAAEFANWANSKMNFHEKQEYNRMLWIIKGREAKDLMLEVPGGSELEHLWS